MPWDQQVDDLNQARFQAMQYYNSYVAIQNFLGNERRVRSALLQFQQDVIAAGVLDVNAFERIYLPRWENMLGFQPYLVLNNPGLHPETFLHNVHNQQPMDDFLNAYAAAGNHHGRSTHRIQWILIGRELANLAANVNIIYGSIGMVRAADDMARVINQAAVNNRSELWDALVDSARDNATCPEYFRGTWLQEANQNNLAELRRLWR